MNVNHICSTQKMINREGHHLNKITVKNINNNTNIFFNNSLIASYYNNCFDFSNIYNKTKSTIKTSITYNSKIGGIINIHNILFKILILNLNMLIMLIFIFIMKYIMILNFLFNYL